MSYRIVSHCDSLDYSKLLEDLESKKGVIINTDPSRWNLTTKGYLEIKKMWDDAKFNPSAIEWINYYPKIHFDDDVILQIKNLLNLQIIHRAWISRVNPGYYAPLHWDVDDNEIIYKNHGSIKRYSIMLGTPLLGQIFILGNKYIFNLAQGSIIKWNNHNDWHAGINASMKPKFMLHIVSN